MINKNRYKIYLFANILLLLSICISNGFSQVSGTFIKGVVYESGTSLPLKQVLISVAATGVSAETDANGNFSINAPDKQVELIIDLPGYIKRSIFLLGRDSIRVSMVSLQYKSFDNTFYNPLGNVSVKDATNSVSYLNMKDIDFTKSTSFDQEIQGKISGLRVIQHSGMPGSRTWMNIRGMSSIYGKNQPLLYIDGMIHDYDYTNLGLMEGFSLNPMDVVDIEDISDISILKNGDSYLGSMSSNGVIYLNTEQKNEASTVIKVSAYTGIANTPAQLDVLNASDYRNYLNSVLNEQGLTNSEVNAKFPWLNGDKTSNGYYKYNNSTDWQKEIYKPALLHKVHMFLKGGDDIATYNISTGYVKQGGIYEKSSFSRFNLRINGKVNITDRFSVTPNAKLSLADSDLPNSGYSAYKSPLISALSDAPIMAVKARNISDGITLPFLDDVGDFNVSNPVALAQTAVGTNRNYNFLSSVNLQYRINQHLLVSNLTGIDFNNSRESLFLPNLGVLKVDSAFNSPSDFASEYRSTQNHTTISYSNKTLSGHSFDVNAGLRYMENTYKNVKLIDLNTASDYVKNLGDGTGELTYLRSSTGEDKGLLWLSYFGSVNYNYLNTYYLNANLSYEGSSSATEKKRYYIYPSIGGAVRLSSIGTLSQSSWLEDLKLRASYSQTGNMLSSVYDYSKLYYVEKRFSAVGILLRESIPNPDLEIEKTNTVNLGLDISLMKQSTNIHFDFYNSKVNNLIIGQSLVDAYGYKSYYDNGGKLTNKGFEISADQRIHIGEIVWTLSGTFAKQTNEITELNFINNSQDKIVTSVEGAEFVTQVGSPINAFYGLKTNGTFQTDAEAANVKGPKGVFMKAGDMRYSNIDKSLDENGITNINADDKTVIGNPNPDFFGGLSSFITYKGFEIGASFTYSIGNDAFNYVRYKAESMDNYNNQLSSVKNRWTTANTSATMPRFSYGDPTGNTVFSDRWIEDASYIRLKQLTINYNLPSTGFYKGLKLFVTASNLLTITKYKGYDPEFMYMNDPYRMGIDYGIMPQTKSVILGVKLDL